MNLSFLIKPASSLCNLRCRYCFYEDEAANREQASMGRMTKETAELLIREAYAASGGSGVISFAFQGGEPAAAGLDFFKDFTACARNNRPGRVRLSFSIQTNVTLLDERWAEFLHDEDFLVGISIDGYKDLHNLYRKDAEGEGPWNRVTRAAQLLNRHQVAVNALCVVTGQCASHAQKAYRTLKKLGFRYQQYIACLDPIGSGRGQMSWSLSPEAYGAFLCELFDLWYQDWSDGNYHSIRLFEDYIHALLGDEESTCSTCGRCGGYFVIEGDGSVYPCDFYVLDEWKTGEIGRQSLTEMRNGETFRRFLKRGAEKPAECAGFSWKRLCNGGCQNDWIRDENGVRNYYCTAFRTLFAYAGERMMQIARAEQRMRRG